MKKLITGLCLLGIAGTCYGKAVDEPTAQNVAYNFYKPKAALQGVNDLSLAYTATSVVNGATVNDFYIFNTGSVTGFVIVSADDNVMPVLGYSNESNFDASKMNPSIKYWLNNYQNEIAYVIQNNINTTSYITAKWNNLESSSPIPVAGKITTGPVGPLLPCTWDQENPNTSHPPYIYNGDCPYDHSTNHADTGETLTGCVATAMAQVMKFWNWPDTAVGSVSYTQHPNPDNIPEQMVNFAVAYHFDSMQIPKVTTPNSYVAKLMYNAGVSVYMDYGTDNEDGSGAYVTENYSGDTTECAEYAMRHYWRYPMSHGIQRHGSQFGSQQPNAWVDTMLNEMNAGRPVIYAGSDTSGQGGHCWVMDGYDNDSFFHFNWGWNNSYDCYVTVNDLNPNTNGQSSGYVFNDEQEAIIHIIPDTPAHTPPPASVSQVASSVSNVKIYPNPATNTINISLDGITANEIVISDIEGRTMQQFVPAQGDNLVTVSVSDLPNGVYLIRLQTDQGTLTRKFVVAK